MRRRINVFFLLVIGWGLSEPIMLGREQVLLNLDSRINEVYYPAFIRATFSGTKLTLSRDSSKKNFGRLVIKTDSGFAIYRVIALDIEGIDVSSRLLSFGVFSKEAKEEKIEIISPKKPILKHSSKVKIISVREVDKNIWEVVLVPDPGKLVTGEILRETLKIEGERAIVDVDVVGIFSG
ncbi:MAG: hypothetical protein QXL01_01265 [Thermoplasmatales archaeon]